MRAVVGLIALLFVAGCNPLQKDPADMPIVYPPTQRGDVVEDHFGQAIPDPYRWLENDARTDTAVAAWVEAQNEVTEAYLRELPGRDVFRRRLGELFDYDQLSAPTKRGQRYFYTRQAELENQAALHVRDSVDGPGRVLIDPNLWSEGGTSALAEWAPSPEGSHVAYAVQEGGTDWRTIRVIDVDTGQVLDDELKWARFTQIEWLKDGSGFFYVRYPEPAEGAAFQAGVANHAIYFHALGTPQSADRLLYSTPDAPHQIHYIDVTSDGRYAAISTLVGAGSNALTVVDLQDPAWRPRPIITNHDHEWSVVGNDGTKLFAITTRGAPLRKIVTIDLAGHRPVFRDLLGQQASVLNNAWTVGGRLITSNLVDAKTELRRYRLDGTPDGVIDLPGIGSAGGFSGDPRDPESFFIFTSFNAPVTVYRYDVAANRSSVWAEPDVAADLDGIEVEQRFYTSKDGARVPMFIVKRKDVTGPAPTLLQAYGGFGIDNVPFYSVPQLAWIEQGGIVAVANIRGGGEYGEAWHRAGMLANRQNAFDDFIAAAEFLKTEGIAKSNGIVIQGESNGGLLVGVAVNQRPDLFAAALPGVGVMDMLRYNRFTGGQLWVAEFGDPAREPDFRTLLAYSPYHNIRKTGAYPAILVTTADTDNRVVPGHSFKYAAALQAADLGNRPRLIRIETEAGHGAGKPINKVIEEVADMWAFAARWTGLDVADPAVRPAR
jgi:prolyl oligopeptidase